MGSAAIKINIAEYKEVAIISNENPLLTNNNDRTIKTIPFSSFVLFIVSTCISIVKVGKIKSSVYIFLSPHFLSLVQNKLYLNDAEFASVWIIRSSRSKCIGCTILNWVPKLAFGIDCI